jgi:tetratricopeptide (TPR) repeat protein
MTTEDEYLERLGERWLPSGVDDLVDVFRIAERAISDYPQSARLLLCYGQLIWLLAVDLGGEYTSDRALKVFEQIIKLGVDAETESDAWEEIGSIYDCNEQYAKARDAFERAMDLHPSVYVYTGLARVLAQQGENDNAIALLESASFSGEDAELIDKMRSEIKDGDWTPIDDEYE